MKLSMRVLATHRETPHVLVAEMAPCDGAPLPGFEPGAHIDVFLPGGVVRSYSLTGVPGDRHYTIGVLNDRNSRGGSRYIHENFVAGLTLDISAPRNHFALDETAACSVFIAGGIGITPIRTMARRMTARGAEVRLLYACRSRADAAFLADIEHGFPSAQFHFDDEAGGVLDLRSYLAEQHRDAHFYCCGPLPMIDAFESLCGKLGLPNVHVERFAAPTAPQAGPAAAFTVHLARTGKTYAIAEDRSILETLLEDGLDLPYSCQAGICGACETGVLAGVPDHQDAVLPSAEQAQNDRMMICVSRCKDGALILDL